jgi:hypothetical protein
VDELELPIDSSGKYARDTKGGFEQAKLVWSYTAPKKKDFYSFFISGAQRLPNGHTLICSGANGTVFEIAPDNEIVWKYVSPVKGAGPGPGGANPAAPFQPGQILAGIVRDRLRLSADQKKQIDQLQKEVDGKLDKLLSDEQKKKLKERPSGGGAPSIPQPGQVMSPTQQASLKLTAEQRKQLRDLQKQVDGQLDKVMTADQKKQFKELRANPGRIVQGGGPPGGIGNALFRAYRYAASYPGLAGKDLTPGKTIEELQAKEKQKPATR